MREKKLKKIRNSKHHIQNQTDDWWLCGKKITVYHERRFINIKKRRVRVSAWFGFPFVKRSGSDTLKQVTLPLAVEHRLEGLEKLKILDIGPEPGRKKRNSKFTESIKIGFHIMTC